MALLLGEIVRRQARHRPERSAYVIGPERVTYRRLNAMANRLAHALRALGVGRGDRVATLAENRVEYPAIYFAVAKLGAIHVPINFRYRAAEVRYVLAQSEASVLLHADGFAGVVEEVRRELDRKSTRLNSSHEWISYAVFCLKKLKHADNTG